MEGAVLLMEFAKADRHTRTESDADNENCKDGQLAHSLPFERPPLQDRNNVCGQTVQSERKMIEIDQALHNERSSLKVNHQISRVYLFVKAANLLLRSILRSTSTNPLTHPPRSIAAKTIPPQSSSSPSAWPLRPPTPFVAIPRPPSHSKLAKPRSSSHTTRTHRPLPGGHARRCRTSA